MGLRTIRTAEKRAQFLKQLADGYSVTNAADACGLGRSALYAWKREDEEFSDAWEEALDAGTDRLEDIARERAAKSSDTLLIFLLKGRRPEKFRDRQTIEHTGANGGPIETSEVNYRDWARAICFAANMPDAEELPN